MCIITHMVFCGMRECAGMCARTHARARVSVCVCAGMGLLWQHQPHTRWPLPSLSCTLNTTTLHKHSCNKPRHDALTVTPPLSCTAPAQLIYTSCHAIAASCKSEPQHDAMPAGATTCCVERETNTPHHQCGPSWFEGALNYFCWLRCQHTAAVQIVSCRHWVLWFA